MKLAYSLFLYFMILNSCFFQNTPKQEQVVKKSISMRILNPYGDSVDFSSSRMDHRIVVRTPKDKFCIKAINSNYEFISASSITTDAMTLYKEGSEYCGVVNKSSYNFIQKFHFVPTDTARYLETDLYVKFIPNEPGRVQPWVWTNPEHLAGFVTMRSTQMLTTITYGFRDTNIYPQKYELLCRDSSPQKINLGRFYFGNDAIEREVTLHQEMTFEINNSISDTNICQLWVRTYVRNQFKDSVYLSFTNGMSIFIDDIDYSQIAKYVQDIDSSSGYVRLKSSLKFHSCQKLYLDSSFRVLGSVLQTHCRIPSLHLNPNLNGVVVPAHTKYWMFLGRSEVLNDSNEVKLVSQLENDSTGPTLYDVYKKTNDTTVWMKILIRR